MMALQMQHLVLHHLMVDLMRVEAKSGFMQVMKNLRIQQLELKIQMFYLCLQLNLMPIPIHSTQV